jgi:hypothetical protein
MPRRPTMMVHDCVCACVRSFCRRCVVCRTPKGRMRQETRDSLKCSCFGFRRRNVRGWDRTAMRGEGVPITSVTRCLMGPTGLSFRKIEGRSCSPRTFEAFSLLQQAYMTSFIGLPSLQTQDASGLRTFSFRRRTTNIRFHSSHPRPITPTFPSLSFFVRPFHNNYRSFTHNVSYHS